MLRLSRYCAAAAALAGAFTAAAAQEAAPPAGEAEIVVTGRDVDREISDFVGALTPAAGRGQLSRFEWAVCPGAAGMAPAQKAAVVKRMRQIAKAAGLKVAGERCSPNVQLILTADKKAMIEGLQQRHPAYFGEMSAGAVRRLAREPGPAAAWHLEGPPLDADGMVIGEQAGGVRINRTVRSGSRVTPATRAHFDAAVVVVESKALEGLTTTQLADYAAMRAFARIDATRVEQASAPTILKVLGAPMGSEVPITLTEWDLAFLRGLYASPAGLHAASQRSEIRKRVGQALENGDGEGKR